MQNKNQQKKKTKSDFTEAYKYSNLGFQILIIILIGTFGGRKLDSVLKLSFPVFTVVLSLSSIGLALYSVFKGLDKKNSLVLKK